MRAHHLKEKDGAEKMVGGGTNRHEAVAGRGDAGIRQEHCGACREVGIAELGAVAFGGCGFEVTLFNKLREPPTSSTLPRLSGALRKAYKSTVVGFAGCE
jgi:hypothetical protein